MESKQITIALWCQTKYSFIPLPWLQERQTTDTQRKTEEQSKHRVLLSYIFSFTQWFGGQTSPQPVRLLFLFKEKISSVHWKIIVCETSIRRESILERNFTWGKNLEIGANTFQKTCAVQAMTQKVLTATDFFHGLPFETKRQFQQELRVMRCSKTQLCGKEPGNSSLTVTLGTSGHHRLTDWQLGAWHALPLKHCSSVLYTSMANNYRTDPCSGWIPQN